ncbi:MAG: T9SS type A sorting domain-containing protein, partial [Opitutaceae bacterium]|nr:T9SS type A sorting domain-containing protein [Cytophagales bacterium]
QINLSVIGDTVCQGFPAQVKILQSGTSVNYELFEGAVAISPVTMGNGSTLIFTLLNLSPGIHTITVRATTSGCGAVTLVNQVKVVVNSSPSVLLNVTAQSPVCSSDSVVPVTIHNSSQGAEYYFYLGNHSLGKYLGNGKDLVLQFALAPLKLGSNEITVNTTVTGCITQVLQQNLTIVVNPIPTLFFEATGNTVRYSNDSATVSIKNAPYGAKLEIYKGLTSLLKPLISNGSEVFWKFAVMDTVTKDFFFTVKGQIDGCKLVSYSDTALIKVRRTITSLTEDISYTNLNVFPNPFPSSFTIQSSIPFTKILITNMLGKSVYESYFDSTSEKMISYDFPKGVYYLQLEGSNFKLKKKLVKE